MCKNKLNTLYFDLILIKHYLIGLREEKIYTLKISWKNAIVLTDWLPDRKIMSVTH